MIGSPAERKMKTGCSSGGYFVESTSRRVKDFATVTLAFSRANRAAAIASRSSAMAYPTHRVR